MKNVLSLGSVSGQVASAKSVAKGTTLTKPLEMDLKTTAATASDQAKGYQTQFGGYESLSLSTKSRLICNEKQQEISTGDIRQTINAHYGSML